MRGMLTIQEYILSQVLTEQVPLYCGLHVLTSVHFDMHHAIVPWPILCISDCI